jgi:hypothetical protein
MSILSTARKLETIIARTFNDAAQRVAPAGSREPLELAHAIVEAVEEEVQPAGRGTHAFPFNRLKIVALAPTRETKARLEAVFDGSPTLQERICERLRAAGCVVPDLRAKVAYTSEIGADWLHPQFHIEFARAAPGSSPPPALTSPRRRLLLDVIAGTASQSAEAAGSTRIDIGRCAEVRDHHHRLIRTNQIAFTDDGAGINDTVSRCHAHVAYHTESGEYRVHDDRSAHGTGVLRNGRTIVVAPGSRGVRLQTGDEIVLGEARLRVAITDQG